MLPKEIIKEAERILSKRFSKDVIIHGSSGVGGGCINDSHRIDTSAGKFFVKYNNTSRYPGMFEAEAKGLKILKDSNTVNVPQVIGHSEAGLYSMLFLEFINSGTGLDDFWQDFGYNLAKMHQTTNTARKNAGTTTAADGIAPGGDGFDETSGNHELAHIGFGLDHNNYIGSLPQSNKWHAKWIDFFVNERIEAQLKLAVDSGKAGVELVRMFQKMYKHLSDFFPEEPPALLHGDLWSGNYMVGSNGRAVIIDPAVYYGHRYIDLGMTQLFGGFSPPFYEAYNDAYTLEASWKKSMDIANLYPLMVHVNLFGGGYQSSVKSILKRF